jgi:hypothetical protein
MITDTNEVVQTEAQSSLYEGLSESERRRLVDLELELPESSDDPLVIAKMTEFRDQMIASRVIEPVKPKSELASTIIVDEDLLKADAKFNATQAEYAAEENDVVKLAASTLDPKDMLKKYAKLGREALKLANRRKASLPAGSWNGAKDFAKVCGDLELLVKSKIAIKHVEFDKYVRIHLWVEAVRPLVPNVEKLSYYQVFNKFLPTLEFDAEALTGEIRKGWIGFVGSIVERQVGDDPLSVKELDFAIDAEKAKIAAEKLAKGKAQTPAEIEATAAKAAESKKRQEKKAAMDKVSDSIDKGIEAGQFTPDEVADIASKVLKTHNLEMPKAGSFDAATCTMNDILMIAKSLATNGKFNEMRFLRDTLDKMIKINDNLLITTKAG